MIMQIIAVDSCYYRHERLLHRKDLFLLVFLLPVPSRSSVFETPGRLLDTKRARWQMSPDNRVNRET